MEMALSPRSEACDASSGDAKLTQTGSAGRPTAPSVQLVLAELAACRASVQVGYVTIVKHVATCGVERQEVAVPTISATQMRQKPTSKPKKGASRPG